MSGPAPARVATNWLVSTAERSTTCRRGPSTPLGTDRGRQRPPGRPLARRLHPPPRPPRNIVGRARQQLSPGTRRQGLRTTRSTTVIPGSPDAPCRRPVQRLAAWSWTETSPGRPTPTPARTMTTIATGSPLATVRAVQRSTAPTPLSSSTTGPRPLPMHNIATRGRLPLSAGTRRQGQPTTRSTTTTFLARIAG